MDASATGAFLGSDDAERVRRLVTKVASNWLPGEKQRDGVLALVQAAAYAAQKALAPELRLWNAQNDRMARLPVELRLHCFSFASGSALLASLAVCAAWNELICGTPDLWQDLDFSVAPLPSTGELAHALRLSRDRLFSLSALVRNQTERYALDDALEMSWHRLRHLRIDHGGFKLFCDYEVFRNPAPHLESLTYLGPDRLACWPLLFDGRAPKLTRVHSRAGLFRDIEYHQWFPFAFNTIRTLTMGRCEVMPADFFTYLPNLRALSVDDVPPVLPFCLPALPPQHPLSHLKLKRYALGTGSILRELGFMRVQRLQVESYCAEVLAIALGRGGSLALRAQVTDKLSISLTPDDPIPASGVIFRSDGFPSRELHKLFHAPGPADRFDAVTALTLARDFPPLSIYANDARFNAALHRTLFPSVPLRRLRTLTLLCGPRAGDALLDAHVLQQCGVLLAPALARLVLRRVRRDAEPVCPLGLAFFVSHHLVMDRPALLEVVVERELGFVDHDDGGAAIEVLESHVGSLVIRIQSPSTMRNPGR